MVLSTYSDIDIDNICDTLVYYRIQPRNTLLADYEIVSTSVSCTKDCTIEPTDPSTAPATNCASANTVLGITIAWLAYEGSSAHLPYVTTKIYRSVNGGAFTLLTTTASNVLSYTDQNVISGSVYSYYVQHQFVIYNTNSTVSPTSISCTMGTDCRDNGPLTSFLISLLIIVNVL